MLRPALHSNSLNWRLPQSQGLPSAEIVVRDLATLPHMDFRAGPLEMNFVHVLSHQVETSLAEGLAVDGGRRVHNG